MTSKRSSVVRTKEEMSDNSGIEVNVHDVRMIAMCLGKSSFATFLVKRSACYAWKV